MKTLLLALCLLSFVACNHRPAPHPPPPVATAPVLSEFAGLDELYRQFQGFRNDRLFLRYGFTANFPQADWLEHVRRQELNPELAERARLLASLAVASRIHGDDGRVTRNFEERFTTSLHTPGPALPPAAPDQDEAQIVAGTEPPPNPPQDSVAATAQNVPAPQPQNQTTPQPAPQELTAEKADPAASTTAEAEPAPTAQIVPAPQPQAQTAPQTAQNNASTPSGDVDGQTRAILEQLARTPSVPDVPPPDKSTSESPAMPSPDADATPPAAGQTAIGNQASGLPPGLPATVVPAVTIQEAVAQAMQAPTASTSTPGAFAQNSTTDGPITILFTGDTQGVIYPQPGIKGTVGGLARRPPIIESVKAEIPSLMLLDAGDAFASGFPRAEIVNKALVRAMNRMRYDAMGLGPHDLAMGEVALRELANIASFPMICSNLEFQKGSTPWVKPYALLERGQRRIAVISLLFPDTAVRITGARVVAPQPALHRLIPQLASQADAIVLMTQAGSEEIAAMLGQGVDVDVILGDARSTTLNSPKYIPAVAKGLGMGLVELRQTTASHQATRTIPLLTSGELDPNILKIIDTLQK